jgi:type I restriction enzyme S subunit
MTPPAAKNTPPRRGFQTLEETGAKSSKGWKIPASWAWKTMGDIAAVVGGGTPKTSHAEFYGGDIPWITPADLSGYKEKFISRGTRNITKLGLDHSGAKLMPAGTVLFSSRAPIGYVAIAANPVSTNQGFKSFVLHDGLDSDFVYYYLQHAKRLAIELASGTTFLEISGKKAAQIPIPIPSLPEQRRIVAEIEKQFTRLEAGVSALKRVQANLKRYRAAVLKAACEGKLVPSDLSAWKQLKVSEIGETITGNTPPTSDKENLGDELPFFKPTDLDAGYNVREARQYLSAKGATLSRVLPAGTVLVTCIGATIGKTGFARVACATNQQINALVVNPQTAIPQWAFLLFSSPVGQQQIKNNASATTLPILNKSKFSALKFPIPPLAEQTRIVAEVERRLSVVEELEAVVSANLQRATRLRQAILQRAFSGELI